MLSPNATKRVADSCGGAGGFGGAARTCTSNPHDAVRCCASSAVQVINVAPNGNLPPLAGEHDELTGVVPPEIVGAAYVIVTGFPSGDESDWLDGTADPERRRLRR